MIEENRNGRLQLIINDEFPELPEYEYNGETYNNWQMGAGEGTRKLFDSNESVVTMYVSSVRDLTAE